MRREDVGCHMKHKSPKRSQIHFKTETHQKPIHTHTSYIQWCLWPEMKRNKYNQKDENKYLAVLVLFSFSGLRWCHFLFLLGVLIGAFLHVCERMRARCYLGGQGRVETDRFWAVHFCQSVNDREGGHSGCERVCPIMPLIYKPVWLEELCFLRSLISGLFSYPSYLRISTAKLSNRIALSFRPTQNLNLLFTFILSLLGDMVLRGSYGLARACVRFWCVLSKWSQGS